MSESEKMFELASRARIRFAFRGTCAVEDLWDLTLSELDSLYKNLSVEYKRKNEESLLETKSKEDMLLELKLSLVKHVFTVMDAEKKERINATAARKQKAKILELVAEKRDEKLKSMSEEELLKMAEEL